jgi:hypothetical protein
VIDFSKVTIDWSRRVMLQPDGERVVCDAPRPVVGSAAVPVASLHMTASVTVSEMELVRYPGLRDETNRRLMQMLHEHTYGELREPVHSLIRLADKNANYWRDIEEARRLRDALLDLLKKP